MNTKTNRISALLTLAMIVAMLLSGTALAANNKSNAQTTDTATTHQTLEEACPKCAELKAFVADQLGGTPDPTLLQRFLDFRSRMNSAFGAPIGDAEDAQAATTKTEDTQTTHTEEHRDFQVKLGTSCTKKGDTSGKWYYLRFGNGRYDDGCYPVNILPDDVDDATYRECIWSHGLVNFSMGTVTLNGTVYQADITSLMYLNQRTTNTGTTQTTHTEEHRDFQVKLGTSCTKNGDTSGKWYYLRFGNGRYDDGCYPVNILPDDVDDATYRKCVWSHGVVDLGRGTITVGNRVYDFNVDNMTYLK